LLPTVTQSQYPSLFFIPTKYPSASPNPTSSTSPTQSNTQTNLELTSTSIITISSSAPWTFNLPTPALYATYIAINYPSNYGADEEGYFPRDCIEYNQNCKSICILDTKDFPSIQIVNKSRFHLLVSYDMNCLKY
jgi:hypothetical protein